MRSFMTSLAAAVSVTSTGAFAQDICTSLDKGDLFIGQTISRERQQQLMAEAPVGTLHCGRTGCTVLASDGVSYSWRRDGRIVGKKIELPDPSSLPGWRGQIDQGLADRLGQATCTTFTVLEEELDGGRSLKSAPLSLSQGQTVVATLFGRGGGDDPLTIEMRAVEP
ncbi:hypothetical protein D3C85_498330 [compost metagenome]